MPRLEIIITLSPEPNATNLTSTSVVEVLRLQLMVAQLLDFLRIVTYHSKIEHVCLANLQSSFHTEHETLHSHTQEPELIATVRKCTENKEGVVICKEGVGGTYFVQDSDKNTVAVFKPTDEEPGAMNNPKNMLSKPLLPPGGGAIREVAAYLLDRNRSGVPETHTIEGITHERLSYSNGILVPKSGSIQRFIPNIGHSGSMGSSRFTVEDVHNIGILDIRILNLDRNSENMLVQKSGDKFRLIPIDHTYSLPETLDNIWVEWMYWRQAKVPFSRETLLYIENINEEADAEILRNLGISELCIFNMKLATILLKRGAASGLNLFQIASLITRKRKCEQSEMEKLVYGARITPSTEKWENTFERLLEELTEKLKISVN